MKKFQTINTTNIIEAPKKPDTTEQVKATLLLAIDNLRVKIKTSDNAKDIDHYVAAIQKLTNSYQELTR